MCVINLCIFTDGQSHVQLKSIVRNLKKYYFLIFFDNFDMWLKKLEYFNIFLPNFTKQGIIIYLLLLIAHSIKLENVA
jgi:hypothetical protein